MKKKKPITPTERLVLFFIFAMMGLMIMPNIHIVPSWTDSIKMEAGTRDLQLAVDSFVAKKFMQPVTGNKVTSCLVPKKIDTAVLKEEYNINSSKNTVYFLDYYGKVWSESPENLLTVTKQEDYIIFNNIGANQYKIWEVEGMNCDKLKLHSTINNSGENYINFYIPNTNNYYLIQPIYNGKEGMLVGVGFDGRLYK